MFLLLTFFIFAFALMVRLKVTDIHLPPTAAGADVQRAVAITIALRPAGEITVNQKPVEREAVVDEVARLKEESPSAILLVAIDERASSGDLFLLMDALRSGGFQDLRFLRIPVEAAAPPTPAEPGPSP